MLLYLAFKRSYNLLSLTLLIVVLSFSLNIWKLASDPIETFYFPLTRVWELLTGSALASLILSQGDYWSRLHNRLDRLLTRVIYAETSLADGSTLKNVQATVGLIFIASIVFGVTKSRAFPGWWALVPTIGAALLISAGPKAWLNRVLLSHKLLVFFGVISFPLYLWHWPLLSFAHLLQGGVPSREVRVLAVLLSVLLAWLTYALIERRIRFGGNGRLKTAVASCVLLAVGVVGGMAWKGVIVPYSERLGVEKIIAARGEWDYPGKAARELAFGGQRFFLFPGERSDITLFFGDSNIEQYAPRIADLLSGNMAMNTAVFATQGGCPPIEEIEDEQNPNCAPFKRTALKYAKSPEVKAVVIGAQWFGYFNDGQGTSRYYFAHDKTSGARQLLKDDPQRGYGKLEETLHSLRASGKIVYLVLNIPYGESIDPSAMVRRSILDLDFSTNVAGLQKDSFLKYYGPIREKLTEIGRQTGAIVIEPLEFLCDANHCPSVMEDGEPIYKDLSHLRPTFTRTNVRFLDETLISITDVQHRNIGETLVPERASGQAAFK